MEKQSKLFLIIVAAISLGAAVFLFQGAVEEQLAPEPHAAWVGIEVAGSGVAEVAPQSLDVGTDFRLHAVLEARDRGGQPVYYSAAPAVRFAGEEVAPDRLERWQRRRPIRVRWFTVEGKRPYVALGEGDGIEAFELGEFLRSDWPLSWSVPGEIDAAHDNHLELDQAEKVQRFGTQRYHVRIELYRDEDSLIPERVIRSWGISDLKEQIERFPTVRLSLPGPAGPASRVFGLTQIEPPPGAGTALRRQIEELADHGVAFSRLTVLRDQIRQTGKRLEDLEWRTVDLEGEARWGADLTAGDLLRVGDRFVVLYEDRGTPGVLDYEDLCFDYVQGAAVRALSDVFVGSGSGNAVELAALGGSTPHRRNQEEEIS